MDLEDYLDLYGDGVFSFDDVMSVFQVYLENQPVPEVPRRSSGTFSLEAYSDAEVRRNFRFEREDLPRLLHLLEIPDEVYTGGSGGGHGYRVPGMTALCILLRRLAYPNRLHDIKLMFSMSKSALSAIAIWMTSHINSLKGHLIKDLGTNRWLNPEKLAQYAEAVTGKGAVLNNCWGFIDGTARKMCRPTNGQELHYSGHKRFHCLKYQSILTPDGLIINLQGPFQGRRHDAGIWTGCGIQRQVRQLCRTPERNYVLYGDPAYPVSDILLAPYPSTNDELHARTFNRAMSSVRQAVEWGFAKVVQQFAFVDFSKNQKFQLQDVGGMYNAAVLLTNCHTCLYSSQTSQFFRLNPPSLETYLAAEL